MITYTDNSTYKLTSPDSDITYTMNGITIVYNDLSLYPPSSYQTGVSAEYYSVNQISFTLNSSNGDILDFSLNSNYNYNKTIFNEDIQQPSYWNRDFELLINGSAIPAGDPVPLPGFPVLVLYNLDYSINGKHRKTNIAQLAIGTLSSIVNIIEWPLFLLNIYINGNNFTYFFEKESDNKKKKTIVSSSTNKSLSIQSLKSNSKTLSTKTLSTFVSTNFNISSIGINSIYSLITSLSNSTDQNVIGNKIQTKLENSINEINNQIIQNENISTSQNLITVLISLLFNPNLVNPIKNNLYKLDKVVLNKTDYENYIAVNNVISNLFVNTNNNKSVSSSTLTSTTSNQIQNFYDNL